jgi:hypothetical protein
MRQPGDTSLPKWHLVVLLTRMAWRPDSRGPKRSRMSRARGMMSTRREAPLLSLRTSRVHCRQPGGRRPRSWRCSRPRRTQCMGQVPTLSSPVADRIVPDASYDVHRRYEPSAAPPNEFNVEVHSPWLQSHWRGRFRIAKLASLRLRAQLNQGDSCLATRQRCQCSSEPRSSSTGAASLSNFVDRVRSSRAGTALGQRQVPEFTCLHGIPCEVERGHKVADECFGTGSRLPFGRVW